MVVTQTPKASASRAAIHSEQKRPVDDLVRYCKDYARERPEVCAAWCFGIGFVLGWKLKPR
jgi:hypothetical protein